MRDRTLYLIGFEQTHSANSCDFGDGQPVMVQDKVWWAHIHLGSTIKTRFDQDKIKDCKGQTFAKDTSLTILREEASFRAAVRNINLFPTFFIIHVHIFENIVRVYCVRINPSCHVYTMILNPQALMLIFIITFTKQKYM